MIDNQDIDWYNTLSLPMRGNMYAKQWDCCSNKDPMGLQPILNGKEKRMTVVLCLRPLELQVLSITQILRTEFCLQKSCGDVMCWAQQALSTH